jgi:hypothetical protein
MTILLISKTAIIKQIFNLVSKKLNIELTTLNICVVNKNYDCIIVEDICFDNSFPASNYTNNFGIITKGATNKKHDFLIQKPFLPATLMSILKQKISENDKNDKKEDIDTKDDALDSIEYVDSLADDISDAIINEDDESIVNSAFIGDGGVLDTKELSKIQALLQNEQADKLNQNEQINKLTKDEDDKNKQENDLSQIIDKVIEEVKDTKTQEQVINLTIDKSNIKELSSLFNILGQSVVDDLTDGKQITLKLQLDR